MPASWPCRLKEWLVHFVRCLAAIWFGWTAGSLVAISIAKLISLLEGPVVDPEHPGHLGSILTFFIGPPVGIVAGVLLGWLAWPPWYHPTAKPTPLPIGEDELQ